MVRKPDVQYIRCYTDGSSARALQLFKSAPKTKLPKVRRKKAMVIRLDPLAYAGILVSMVMLVMMVVSCFQLRAIQEKTYQMDSYVDTLKEQNARLSHNYHTGYDLKDVEKKAKAMGMVPMEEVRRITVSVEEPVEEMAENSTWAFLTDLTD